MSNTIYYVYIYRDPITHLPFYVGKGQGQRAWVHLTEKNKKNGNKLKWCKLESLKNRGLSPIIEIFMCTKDEEYAYDIEKELIEFYGRKLFEKNGLLTNMCLDNRPPSYAGKMPRSKEYLENMSKAKIGDKNPMYNKTPWNKNKSGYNTTKKGKKYKWITNGTETKSIPFNSNIPDGWKSGRQIKSRVMPKTYIKKIWINNGKDSKMHPRDQKLPAGWTAGRLSLKIKK